MGVSFDLFGTLVTATRPTDPAAAVEDALAASGVSVPVDWATAYTTSHIDVDAGRELSLVDHVAAALESRGVDVDRRLVESAVKTAFEPTVTPRVGALDTVERVRTSGPIAICSNCSVPGLVHRTLERSPYDIDWFDAIVTSVDCGWRKPAPQIFELTAERIGVTVTDLVHVGDDHRTDGGIEAHGGTAVIIEDGPLADEPLSSILEGQP